MLSTGLYDFFGIQPSRFNISAIASVKIGVKISISYRKVGNPRSDNFFPPTGCLPLLRSWLYSDVSNNF